MRQTRPIGRVAFHVLIIAACIVMIYPILWMFFSSLKPTSEIFSSTALLPKHWVWSNYRGGWTGLPDITFGTFFLNSFIVAGLVVVGNTLSCSLAGFAFGRLRFKLRGLWFTVMLVTMMLPMQVTMIPKYILFKTMGWVNSFLPLTVPSFFAVTSFFIFLIVQFVRTIPEELDESALIDGANTFDIYLRLILPIMTPALITTAIFSFIWTWDDFLRQLIYLSNTHLYTVPLGLRLFIDATGSSQWGEMFAMSILSLVPVFLIFLFSQRYLVEGIATTGLKG